MNKDNHPYPGLRATQLIRRAVRPEINKNTDTTDLDGLQRASDVLRNLKSRGGTRYLVLNRINKRNIDDIDSDEQQDVTP